MNLFVIVWCNKRKKDLFIMYIAITGSKNNKDVYIYRSFRKENGKVSVEFSKASTFIQQTRYWKHYALCK